MPNIVARFAGLAAWARFALLALVGVIAGLGQAPIDLWPATLVALALVLALHRHCVSPRQAMFHTWAFGVGYFAFSLRWIIEPFLVDVARHGWMAPFALVLMASGAALFWGVAARTAQQLIPRSALFLGLLLVVAEVTRSLILTGFPWALIGHIWVPTPVAQLAAFGGPHLLSLVTILVAWAIASLPTRSRWAGIAVLVIIAALAFVVRPASVPNARADAPIIRLVQPNAPQNQKWDPAYRDVFLNRLVTYTGDGVVPDLVVWPETAIPFLLNHIEDDMSLLSDAARGAPLVFGIQRRDAERRFFNSLVVMGPGGQLQSVYDKRHLVPFGEYIPGGNLLGGLGISGLATTDGGGFAKGATPGPIDLPGLGKAVPLICYEGIFAEEVTDGGDRARLLLLITNDAWFGQAAGPYQHLAQARLRTIEQGLPMVRVANTGISAMIDAKGRIIASLPLGVDGALDIALPDALPPTFYVVWGDWPLIGILILLTFCRYGLRGRDSD
jgi:apolipoprotein N-acyltransferase